MEEKNISEKESLEIISKMIDQTKKESAIGSGNMFLVWGYLLTFISLAMLVLLYTKADSSLKWLWIAVPIVTFIAVGIIANRLSKKFNKPATYPTKSVNRIWGCLAGVFAAYIVICFFHLETPHVWMGLYFLGLILPGIGTYCTGAILKENALHLCGLIGIVTSLGYLCNICCYAGGDDVSSVFMDNPRTLPILLAVSLIITLVIPGHILNHKAKKVNV